MNPAGLTRRHVAVGLSLIAAAVILRGLMLGDFLHVNPAARTLQGDAGVYWSWAARIADGQLIDDKPFLSVPLHPHLLALIRTCGGGLTTVFVVALVIHVATGGLIGWLGTRKVGPAVGLTAMGVFFLLEEPAFFALRVLPSTTQLFLVAATLLAADRFRETGRTRYAALVGFLTGLLTLVYPPAVTLVPLLFLWMWLRPKRPALSAASGGLKSGLVAVTAGCLAILPATLHNAAACGEFIPITAHAGITFRQGNAPESNGVYTSIAGVSHIRERMHRDTARVFTAATGRRGSYGEVDRFFLMRGLSYLARNPLRAARLMSRKLYWFLTGRDYYDFDHLPLERSGGLLNLIFLAPIPTAWLMGPALVGLVALWRKRRLCAMDAALVILPLAVVAMFFYSPRYRLVVLPVVSVAVATAIVASVRAAGGHPRRLAPAAILLVALLASAAAGPINRAVGFDFAEKYRPQYERNLGQLYNRREQYDMALIHLARSNRLLPDQPEVLAAMAHASAQLNRFDEAERLAARCRALDPDSSLTYLAQGRLRLKLEQWPQAQQWFQKCLSLDPLSAEAHLGLWWSLSHQGRQREGIEHLAKSIEIDPSNPLAVSEHGIWLAERGRFREAEKRLRTSRRLSPDRPEAHYNLGAVLMELGRAQGASGYSREAKACFREALRLNPAYTRAAQRLREIHDAETRPAQP